MSKSIADELKSRDFEEVKRPAFTSGVIASCLVILLLALQVTVLFVPLKPIYLDIIGVISLLHLVFFIQYWTKINWYKRILEQDTEQEGIAEK
jgi:hypothetical protein